jgi:hypothetical protein
VPATTWTDSDNRSWSCAITVATVKRVQQLAKVNLLEAFDGLLMKLADDPVSLANVLYAVCKLQADERDVTDEQFGELLGGETIEAATTALVQGIIDFFPSQRRQVLKQIWAKTQKARQAVTDLAVEKVESPKLDELQTLELQAAGAEFDRRIEKLRQQAERKLTDPGDSSGSSPDSSASIPAP